MGEAEAPSDGSLSIRKREGEETDAVGAHARGDEEHIWLKPELVAQIEFTEWTPDGHLRHSKFCAFRDDKEPTLK